MLVFTNGCFDILHRGHIDLLERARALGDRLIVGLNSDHSVRRIKGPKRPIHNQDDRRTLLLALKAVDEVVVFDEATPERLIREVRPDVLVKGGDWKADEIVGADFVRAHGGRVVSLPLLEGYSTSVIVERTAPADGPRPHDRGPIAGALIQHLEVFRQAADELPASIEESATLICDAVRSGNKILVCGNGGSAADAQHLAAEFTGRYETERKGLPAIALTTDTSALTAIANDYGFERVFARQVEALASPGDCLIAISTSGNSPNVIAAVMEARSRGCRIVGLTGAGGKKLASLSDAAIIVPSDRTARVQEMHITIAHIWCELVDLMLAGD